MTDSLSSESGPSALVPHLRVIFLPICMRGVMAGAKKSRWLNTGRHLLLWQNCHWFKKVGAGHERKGWLDVHGTRDLFSKKERGRNGS